MFSPLEFVGSLMRWKFFSVAYLHRHSFRCIDKICERNSTCWKPKEEVLQLSLSLSLCQDDLPEYGLIIFMTNGLFVREEFLIEITQFDQSLPLFAELIDMRVQATFHRESHSVRRFREEFSPIFVDPSFDALFPRGTFLCRCDAMLIVGRIDRHEKMTLAHLWKFCSRRHLFESKTNKGEGERERVACCARTFLRSLEAIHVFCREREKASRRVNTHYCSQYRLVSRFACWTGHSDRRKIYFDQMRI